MLTIATNIDHWISPFSFQFPKNQGGNVYHLTTREKVIAIALAILTLPLLLIGGALTFYLTTAYFKNRKIKEIERQTQHDGLTIKGICPFQSEISIYKGFGLFRLGEVHSEMICPCCTCLAKKITSVLKNCKYIYEGKKYKCTPAEFHLASREYRLTQNIDAIHFDFEQVYLENQIPQDQKEYPFYLEENTLWMFLLLKVEPIIP